MKEQERSVGCIEPSVRQYIVTQTHDHLTLKPGDLVVMTITPETGRNLLLRISDMTLHVLVDLNEQYVHLVEN